MYLRFRHSDVGVRWNSGLQFMCCGVRVAGGCNRIKTLINACNRSVWNLFSYVQFLFRNSAFKKFADYNNNYILLTLVNIGHNFITIYS